MKRFFDYKESGDKGPYSIKPIPTKYKGRWYRSRLEAKWAVMFEKLKWRAEYEPSEINGYNPDFIISTTTPRVHGTTTIIVEIKPSYLVTPELIIETDKKYEGVPAHVFLLTDMPFQKYDEDFGLVVLGYGAVYYHGERNWLDDYMVMKCADDCSSFHGGWDGIVKGVVERKDFLYTNTSYSDNLVYEKLQQQWSKACNTTMFKFKHKDK